MIVQRWVVLAFGAALFGASAGQAAELPSQRGHANKPRQAEPARKCDIAGSPGVLAANNVCVKFSGYVSSEFSAGQLK
jgi:hypothetical protein